MTTAWVYCLHFDEPLHHARHYIGTTTDVKKRLITHAGGGGARLTEVLHDRDLTWRLAGLYQTTATNMRRTERQIKARHNGPRLCPLCTDNPIAPPGCIAYDVGLCNFATRSIDLINGPWSLNRRVVQPVTDDEHLHAQAFIRTLQRAEKEALGFIPSGGSAGLYGLSTRGQVLIAVNNDIPVAFAAWTLGHGSANIQQTATIDTERRLHHATELVREIRRRHPMLPTTANVRADLTANEFWRAFGFVLESTHVHPTSRHTINHWSMPCLIKSSAKPFTARTTTD